MITTRFTPAPKHRPAVRRWLMTLMALVALMVLVGGVTRLTESGLSIVEWKLFTGTFPPMTEEAWQKEFSDYQTSPQYKQVNLDFNVHDFKKIFWLEYLHRLLGRVIGLVAIIPLAYFLARRALPRALGWRMTGIAALIGAQGGVGWIMVASGLVDQPRVEPIKLALHLMLAFTVFVLMLWTYWQMQQHPRPLARRWAAFAARGLVLLTTIQIAFGALVAGLRAGKTYNTFPKMDGQWIPEGLHLLQPWWLNHLESVLTVQFQHRVGAWLLAACVLGFVVTYWRQSALRPVLVALAAVVVAQFALGVITLLSGVALWLASAHQLMALLLLALLVRACYLTTPTDSHSQQLAK